MKDAATPGPVRRITVRWADGGWTVTSETRVEAMTLPRSDELPPTDQNTPTRGFWFEVVDKAGRPLYRQGLLHPLMPHELFDDDGTPYREGAGGGEVEFEILVPDLTEAEVVRFFSDQRPDLEGGLLTTDRAEIVGAIALKRDEQKRPRGPAGPGQDEGRGSR